VGSTYLFDFGIMSSSSASASNSEADEQLLFNNNKQFVYVGRDIVKRHINDDGTEIIIGNDDSDTGHVLDSREGQQQHQIVATSSSRLPQRQPHSIIEAFPIIPLAADRNTCPLQKEKSSCQNNGQSYVRDYEEDVHPEFTVDCSETMSAFCSCPNDMNLVAIASDDCLQIWDISSAWSSRSPAAVINESIYIRSAVQTAFQRCGHDSSSFLHFMLTRDDLRNDNNNNNDANDREGTTSIHIPKHLPMQTRGFITQMRQPHSGNMLVL
jgi:hypothetical protein